MSSSLLSSHQEEELRHRQTHNHNDTIITAATMGRTSTEGDNENNEYNGGRDGLMKDEDTTNGQLAGTTTDSRLPPPPSLDEGNSGWVQTVAGVAGNVLEWYDFAVFGYFSDIIGDVFFPPNQGGNKSTIESFVVFGGAFLMRPVGGLLLGYIGDVYGRKKALVLSIFLMAFPTFAMGLLPTYAQIGDWAIVLLVIVRLLQGLSVGGQLMSSLVFTLENHEPSKWGLYGSFVMAAANFGTLLGGIAGFLLRENLSQDALISWGWRLPFLSGIVVSLSGLYLKSHGGDHDGHHYHKFGSQQELPNDEGEDEITAPPQNPLYQALSSSNLRPLLSSCMVPMLWSAGFYLSFVWMAIFMTDLIDKPVPGSFGVNSASLFFSVCLLFPLAGILSDRYGRVRVLTIGGSAMGILSPIIVVLIGRGNAVMAFFAQSILGIALSLWGAPMCAWLVESFEPDARLTSISIGYNVAQALAGGTTPFIATILVQDYGPGAPGWILTCLAVIALVGLRCVAPPLPSKPSSSQNNSTGVAGECELVETPKDDDCDDLL